MFTCPHCTFEYVPFPATSLRACPACGSPRDPGTGGVREPRQPLPVTPSGSLAFDSDENILVML